MILKQCQVCEKEFVAQSNQIKQGYGKYCSVACCAKAKTGKRHSPEHNKKIREKLQSPDMRAKVSYAMLEEKINTAWYGSVEYKDDPRYCEKWTPNLRERVRAFFNYQCVECGTPQNGKKLTIHHVWYNKRMCCDSTPRSLVPLCHSCHTRTNHNRKYWSNHFQEIIDTYYSGKCWVTKEEMKAIRSLNNPSSFIGRLRARDALRECPEMGKGDEVRTW